MKILIVDDEPRHLRGMMNLIRQLRPDAEVTAAKDGAAALEQARQVHPEAILTDIRMPHMDGLAFLEKLNEEGIISKVIIVSAYNMFEYAQRAIRHGAYDYLLKPVEVENVERVLDRIELQLRSESIRRMETEELKQQLTLASSAYRSRLYMAWLNESLTPSEQEEMNKVEWLKGGGFLIFSEWREGGTEEASITEFTYLQVLEQGWSRLGKAVSMSIPQNGFRDKGLLAITFLRPSSASLPLTLEPKLRSAAGSLFRELPETGRLTHGVSPYCESLFEKGPQAFRQAREANEHNFFACWEGLFLYDQEGESNNSAPVDLEKLFDALLADGPLAAMEQCRAVFEKLSDAGHAKPALMKEQASLLLMKIKSRVHELIDRKVDNRLTQSAAALVQDCGSFEELMELLELSLQEVHQALKQLQQDKSELVAANCLKWIQEHMKEELTLDRAAEHFFFNASYFSTFIKNKTGKTFSEHVTAVRMKRAKELLAENKYKIYEISAECGYQDTKYFCRVFKKHHGISPEAYKHASLPERRHNEE